ncbi:phage tail protein [Pasteurella sp. PK-2025]|uniref:phage tail-collar fiber domain-containing protein n=1 Tax=Pasteurella sp. PK-2025 TaxID=3413133 RepID=UPI003C70763D
MAKQYYSVLTTYGSQQLATAIASHQPLNITHFAVGDGNGQAVTPALARTSLVREVYRATISAVSRDPRNNKQVIFELTIPENVGGFHIREMGIFDNQNKLIAYANCPESFKPTLSSGSGKIQVMRMILLVESSDAVTMKVDDSVIFVTRGQLTPKKITAESQNGVDNEGHSHEIEQASTTVKGIVKLTDALNLNDSTLALTAKAGKQLKDEIGECIKNNKKSSSTNSNSEDTVATSKAVKAVADIANAKQSPATTLAGYGIADFKIEQLSQNVNLNDVKTPGIYGQDNWRYATRDNNYPEDSKKGALTVYNVGNDCIQEYRVKNVGLIFRRAFESNNWSAWNKMNVERSSDISDFNQAVNQVINQSFTYQKISDFEIWKFPNGLMIQTYRWALPLGRNSPIGGDSFNWAVTFVEKPRISISSEINSGNQADTWINLGKTGTGSKCVFYINESFFHNEQKHVEFHAIGRWK